MGCMHAWWMYQYQCQPVTSLPLYQNLYLDLLWSPSFPQLREVQAFIQVKYGGRGALDFQQAGGHDTTWVQVRGGFRVSVLGEEVVMGPRGRGTMAPAQQRNITTNAPPQYTRPPPPGVPLPAQRLARLSPQGRGAHH